MNPQSDERPGEEDTPTEVGAPRRSCAIAVLLMLAVVVAQLVAVWSVRYFPSQDGPAHVANAKILLKYNRADQSLLRQYYALNHNPEPNLAGHLLMAGLMTMLSLLVAEKVLVSAYLVALPLAMWYALRGVRGDAGWLAVLVLPLAMNLPLHKGLYNFCLSLPMFFVIVGFFLRRRGSFNPGAAAGLAALSLALFFCHVVALILAYVTLGLLAIWFAWIDLRERRARGEPIRRVLVTRFAFPLIAFGPTLILLGRFFLKKGTEASQNLGKMQMLLRLFELDALVSYAKSERAIALLVAILFCAATFCVAVKKLRCPSCRGATDGLLLPVLASVAIYFLAPNSMSGGGQLTFRLSLFPFFLVLLWLATIEWGCISRAVVLVLAPLLALSMAGQHAIRYRELDRYLREFASAGAHIEPHTTVLPVLLSDTGRRPSGAPLSLKIRIFLHAGGYLAATRDVIDLSNYEASTGYFPTLFRPEIDPSSLPGENGAAILQYPHQTAGAGAVDYVYVWQVREPDAPEKLAALERTIAGAYERVFVTPRGYGTLYRRRDLPSSMQSR